MFRTPPPQKSAEAPTVTQKKTFQAEYAELQAQHQAKLKELSTVRSDAQNKITGKKGRVFEGVTVEDLKKMEPAERLRNPNLKFEGEDEIPTEYQVLMRELDNDYEKKKLEVRELFKNPEFILYEKVLTTRIRAMNLAWMIDPMPPRPTDHAELEAKRKQIIDETKEEFKAFADLRQSMTEAQQKKQFVQWLKEIEYLRIKAEQEKDKKAKEVRQEEVDALVNMVNEYDAEMKKTLAEEKKETEGKLYKDYDNINIYRDEVIHHGETPFSPVDRIMAHLHRRDRHKKMEEEAKFNSALKQGVDDGWEDILGRKPSAEEKGLLEDTRSILGSDNSYISPFASIIPQSEEEAAVEAAQDAEGSNYMPKTLTDQMQYSVLRNFVDTQHKAEFKRKKARELKEKQKLERFLRANGVDVDALNEGKIPWPTSADEADKLRNPAVALIESARREASKELVQELAEPDSAPKPKKTKVKAKKKVSTKSKSKVAVKSNLG